MMLRTTLLLGSLALYISSATGATILGTTAIATTDTSTDIGAGGHLTSIILTWDTDINNPGGAVSARLPNGSDVTDWAYTDEAAGTTAGAAVTPLIFEATGGGYEIVTIGSTTQGAFVPVVGSATIPATGDFYPGFYMPVPASDGGGVNHAPVGFVGEFGNLPNNDGSVEFDRVTAGPPIAAGPGTFTPDGLSPLDRTYNFSVTVPEPSSALLGLLGLGLLARRCR